MNHKRKLKEYMSKLDMQQFKLFYSIFVHYWVKHKVFISNQNFLNLWCELNLICADVGEGFPDPYNHELIKSYCQAHPYYFIDILDLRLIINLFCEHCNDRLDILIQVIDKLDTEGLRAAYAYSNETLELNENIDGLVCETEKWMKNCGGGLTKAIS
jgi:hypothetical protein